MGMEIAVAEQSDIGECAAVLAAAFADDPIMCVLWPNRRWRHRVLPDYFAASIRYHHLQGGAVDVARDRGRIFAVADWDPPGREQQSVGDTLRAGPTFIRLFRHRLLNAIAVRRTLDSHAPAPPFWYLAHIGSHPSARGRGYAQALMTHRLHRADADGGSAYLVCTSVETTSFYEHHGFAVSTTFRLGASGPPLWGMVRAGAQ